MLHSRNPLALSPLGYGAWEAGGGRTWGRNASQEDVVEAIWKSVERGVNWIDTAEVYGGGGGSERLLGEVVSGLTGVRICTKVAPGDGDEAFTESGLRRALERSMERLRRSHVELYLLHWPAERFPLEQTWEAMAGLREEGLVDSIGLSNFPLESIRTCAHISAVDYIQVQGSLLHTVELSQFGPYCREMDIGLLTYGCLAYGLLSGQIDESTMFNDWRNGTIMAEDFFCSDNYSRFFASAALRKSVKVVRNLEALAKDLGCTAAQLALAWLILRPEVTAALAGTRNPAHAAENAGAVELELDENALVAIEGLRRVNVV